MKQSDITELRPLDLHAARAAVRHVVEAERRAEHGLGELLQFRFHRCCSLRRPPTGGEGAADG